MAPLQQLLAVAQQ